MDYHWYPGHMTKTIRQMQEDMKLIDLVIEIADARLPRSSRNPDIETLAAGKARMIWRIRRGARPGGGPSKKRDCIRC